MAAEGDCDKWNDPRVTARCVPGTTWDGGWKGKCTASPWPDFLKKKKLSEKTNFIITQYRQKKNKTKKAAFSPAERQTKSSCFLKKLKSKKPHEVT